MTTESTESADMIRCSQCDAEVSPDMTVHFDDVSVCINCKATYVQRLREGAPDHAAPEAVAIREEHLKHEASIKGMGALFILGGVISFVYTMFFFVNARTGVMALILGTLSLTAGVLLRRLDPRAKLPATLLCAVGLINFPIGTLINIYFLYLLYSQKGKMVLSAEYKKSWRTRPNSSTAHRSTSSCCC